MKLSKSTTVLLNIVLVLCIAILIKTLMLTPSIVNAKTYQNSAVAQVGQYGVWYVDENNLGEAINKITKEGCKFVTISSYTRNAYYKVLIFER